MSRQIRILLAGVLVVVPFAITVYVIVAVGMWLNSLGDAALGAVLADDAKIPTGVGVLALLVTIYVVGLLTHLWIFRSAVGLIEKLVLRIPGAKTIYESIRDLLKMFSPTAKAIGKVVECKIPGTEMTALGLQTNDQPKGISDGPGPKKVAVYLPFGYMIGGPVVFVAPENLREVDLSAQEALKLAATAHVGPGTDESPAPEPGDVMKLQIEVDEDGRVRNAKFKAFGSGSAGEDPTEPKP